MLSERERLRLQQLRLLAWAEGRGQDTDDGEEPLRSEQLDLDWPAWEDRWKLTRGIDLRPWQEQAAEAWFDTGKRGTIKVVTGAGKTVLALAIAERLQQSDRDLRVAIVVPTIVLMHQWRDALRASGNLPDDTIRLLGGGHRGDFSGGARILIAVLASARKELPKIVRGGGVGEHLLLIADECHRVGAPEMSAVLTTPRRYSLGLSATPERDDSDGDRVVERTDGVEEIGPIVYEMTFADAIRDGILPPFEVHHIGLPLTADEARQYTVLSRSIMELRRELIAVSPAARKAGGGERLLSWARRASSRSSGQLSGIAARYVNDTRRRKQLLYRAESRKIATIELVQRALKSRADARVILFHESIDEVVELFERLMRSGIPAVMEHSELPSELREQTLELFRAGTAQVVVSARSLIEGFNVPEADLGIIVASSSSPRQRIQSIGRVLRRYRDESGEQKTSRVCVLYIRDTVDESIYEREDWDKLIGLDRNRYFTWDTSGEPEEQDGPPRAAVPAETEIDLDAMTVGGVYPGRYDGSDFSTDSLGNVLDADGRIARNPQGLPDLVARLRGGPGRFKVTPRRQAVLVLEPLEDGGWQTLFGGTLHEPFEFTSPNPNPQDVDVSALAPGDPYGGPVEPAEELRYRQRGGGVIAKRTRGGEAFARGADAERVVETMRDLTRARGPIAKIFVNRLGHVYWREGGAARFIAALREGFEFPALEGK